MNSVQILTVIFDIFCPLATGYILRKKGWMSQKACNALMLFNVVALITVMNLMSFWILPISRSFILLPILSVVMALLSVGLAVFVFGRSLSDPLEKGSFAVSAMLSNIGTLGGICAFIAYGEISFAYVQLFAVPQNVLMVILAFPLAQYYYAKKIGVRSGTPLGDQHQRYVLYEKAAGGIGDAHWPGPAAGRGGTAAGGGQFLPLSGAHPGLDRLYPGGLHH